VRTFAREIGVDVHRVQGSGPAGRIDVEDVKRYARERGTAPASAAHELPALPDFEQFGPVERQPLSRFRRTVARNMTTTWSQVPLVTLFSTADTSAFEAIRRRYREAASKAGGTLTDGVLMMKLVGAALEQFPQFNSSYDEAAQELIVKRYVHIGLAVDTERGLVVPVVRDVDKKSIVDLAVDFRGISERVKENALTLDEMRGASFTISSLETLGVSHFTPLVNWPEVAILGIGRDADMPSYEREELRVHKRVALSLSFDHRVVDGADGARFLRWLVNAIHEPAMLEVPESAS
jgi:pyruvate dehydrogenase E2 component (dihydrolipoamide acetyltransferase)